MQIKSKKAQDRRNLLKLASGLLLTPMGGMHGMMANAQTGTAKPLRLLTVIDSYGIPHDIRPSAWVSSEAGDYNLQASHLGTITQPFANYVDNMIFVSGIEHTIRNYHRDPATHHYLTTHVLGGSIKISGFDATQILAHPTLDVALGDYLDGAGTLPNRRQFPHLFFTDAATRDQASMVYGQDGTQIRSIAGVPAIMDTVIGNLPTGDAATNVQLMAKSGMLDIVSSHVQTLKSRVNNENFSHKFDAYNTSLSELADSLEEQAAMSACAVPDETSSLNTTSTENIFTLIGQLFACDAASAITYNIGGEKINQLRYGHIADGTTDAEVATILRRSAHSATHRTDAAAYKAMEMRRINQAQDIAKLLDTLSNTVDIDGSSVMDNTIVYWASAMSHNVHGTNDFPNLIIAGNNTNLNGGAHYFCGANSTNDLLTTIAQGMNVPFAEYGGYNGNTKNELVNSGPIERMLKSRIA